MLRNQKLITLFVIRRLKYPEEKKSVPICFCLFCLLSFPNCKFCVLQAGDKRRSRLFYPSLKKTQDRN